MLKAQTRRWGNSLGIVIPKKAVQELGLKPHEEVLIEVKKGGNVLKGMFGTVRWKKPISEILREARRELESKFDR
jgi:antitoxin component of MazEF toxin-antitoxin module